MIEMFFVHSVSVQTCTGQGAYGPVLATPQDVACYIDDSVKLVRNAAGDEVVSSTRIRTALANADLFPANSEVTVSGRVARVIAVNSLDGDALGLPSHAVISLT